jgi:hypothetical protein
MVTVLVTVLAAVALWRTGVQARLRGFELNATGLGVLAALCMVYVAAATSLVVFGAPQRITAREAAEADVD